MPAPDALPGDVLLETPTRNELPPSREEEIRMRGYLDGQNSYIVDHLYEPTEIPAIPAPEGFGTTAYKWYKEGFCDAYLDMWMARNAIPKG